ncbi:MAG: hypothetical protein CL908_13365 [Deltaproteobacteria bacterium]|nr:hypothetical protein [Deltaproteobacteria bacterium]
MAKTWDYIRPLNIEEEARRFESGKPFRHIVVDDFLRPEFAREVCRAYPAYEDARASSEREFKAANEYHKIQIVDSSIFPEPVRLLSEALQSRELLETLTEITGIPDILADSGYCGGGMHLMETGSHLDLHVDFNHLDERLYRRLNIILYLNEDWQEGWGGDLDLWDGDVKECAHVVAPVANRVVIFNTVPRSFHGVRNVTCPADHSRNTFASFYYTKEVPPEWEGKFEGTVWARRPGERRLMEVPERLLKAIPTTLRKAKRALQGRNG